jgi:hypothetical protein
VKRQRTSCSVCGAKTRTVSGLCYDCGPCAKVSPDRLTEDAGHWERRGLIKVWVPRVTPREQRLRDLSAERLTNTWWEQRPEPFDDSEFAQASRRRELAEAWQEHVAEQGAAS